MLLRCCSVIVDVVVDVVVLLLMLLSCCDALAVNLLSCRVCALCVVV